MLGLPGLEGWQGRLDRKDGWVDQIGRVVGQVGQEGWQGRLDKKDGRVGWKGRMVGLIRQVGQDGKIGQVGQDGKIGQVEQDGYQGYLDWKDWQDWLVYRFYGWYIGSKDLQPSMTPFKQTTPSLSNNLPSFYHYPTTLSICLSLIYTYLSIYIYLFKTYI